MNVILSTQKRIGAKSFNSSSNCELLIEPFTLPCTLTMHEEHIFEEEKPEASSFSST